MSPTTNQGPRIAITMGDPAGIGPEIVLKALLDPAAAAARLVVIGDADLLARTAASLHLPLEVRRVAEPTEAPDAPDGTVAVIDPGLLPTGWHEIGRISPIAGAAAVGYVLKAVELAKAGQVDAIATAPLNKAAMHAAGYTRYAGHTEILADAVGSKEAAMLLVARNLRVIHVTTHVSLADAIGRTRPERVAKVIRLAHQAVRDLGIEQPRIAVAGLNPHAGEGGLFGQEEIEIIGPAIAGCRADGIDVTGPWPADTVFYRAAHLDQFDAVVAMYHDQGHIPIKMYAFDHGVNMTVGLSIIRTSVDHGTAFDIAGQGIASPLSMVEAIRVAVQIVRARAAQSEGR